MRDTPFSKILNANKDDALSYAQWLAKQTEPGCTRIKSGEDIQPRKRFRVSQGNK